MKNFTIKNSILIQDYLTRSNLSYFVRHQILDTFKYEGFKHVFVNMNKDDELKYEASPCGQILMIGEFKLELLINHISTNLLVN